MTLKEWLDKQGKSSAELARDLNYSHPQVWRVVTGRMQPGVKLAKKIVDITGGLVSLNDLYGKF